MSAALFVGLAALVLLHPRTPLSPEWNPLEPVNLSQPRTLLTPWKMGRATEGNACFAALRSGSVAFTVLPDFESSEVCHIRDRVRIEGIGSVAIDPVETKCATALRLAFWVEHGLQPAADDILGSSMTQLHHLSSYNCRQIRTVAGASGRMSTHATAEAIDITGVSLADGRRITLINDWGQGAAGDFLRAARDSACTWFVTTLGPDFNRLHADHFHLQSRGWGLCR